MKFCGFEQVLGRGSFGKVMLVEHKETKDILAMKILRKEAIVRRNQVSNHVSMIMMFELAHAGTFC